MLKKLTGELGRLRNKYAGGIMTATDAAGLGTIHDVLVEVHNGGRHTRGS